MKIGFKAVILLGFLIASYITGLLIFTKGFLLVRTMIHKNSSCEVEFAIRADDLAHGGHHGCWSHARFKKAIVIIIDALRYDFLAYDIRLEDSHVPPYKNKMKNVHQMLIKHPRNTQLYKFIADPPTTTLQRLKGLTTGSLPTFVDAGANFDSSEIKEDNWIDQLITQGKKVTFLGDDTWDSLFPNRFHKSFPFPSFNVKDLHTVDNGILKHLYTEIRQNDWDIIIAHFLGVDHCGHRFGPKHPAMAEKLQQMDQVIRNISHLMKEDTVLFILGDHGMTRTGDHGGDSEDELTSGLFVYSPAHITASSPFSEDKPTLVQQTDLVPTISLLLGVPIPFSNLGTVMPNLFNHCPWWDTQHNDIRQVFHTVKALHLNALQVSQYLNTYATISSDLPESKFRHLQSSLKEAEAELQALVTGVMAGTASRGLVERLLQLQDHYLSYLSQVRSMCQEVWAKFDLTSMVLGTVMVVGALMLNVALSLGWTGEGGQEGGGQELPSYVPFVVGGVVVQVVYYIVHVTVFPSSVLPIMAYVLGALVIFTLAIFLKKRINEMWRDEKTSVVDVVVATVATLMYFSAFFSNSFVVYEDAVSHFLSQTLLWYISARVIANGCRLSVKENVTGRWSRKAKQSSFVDIMERLTQPAVVTFAVTVLCSALLRCSAHFRACREEQWECETPLFLQPLSSFPEDASEYKNRRYFFSITCIFATVWMIRCWLQHYGNLNGDGLNVMSTKFLLPAGAVACALHWAIQALPQKELDSLPPWQQTVMARVVYACVIIHLFISLAQPLYVYIQHSAPSSKVSVPIVNFGTEQTVPYVYRQLQRYWHCKDDGSNSQPPLAAYGLGSVYSSHLVAFAVAIFLLLVMLLGDGAGPALALAVWVVFVFLELTAAYCRGGAASCSEGTHVQQPALWLIVVTHGILSSAFFYATGHQATIPSIRFESAFTGFHGDFYGHFIPALLITLNTYAGPVLFSAVSPLLLLWPHLQGPLCRWMVVERKRGGGGQDEGGEWKGDFAVFDDGVQLRRTLFVTACRILLFQGVKVLGAACAAGLHRRHLMVWKIFAPRFIFEACNLIVMSASLLTVTLIVLRVDHCLSKLTKSLQKAS